ncbi:CHAT domain-containing protein [Actinokineospora alba]|uniref:CHAT domain-containing protein n=1 Tax=Actinokineospora alba TaxID=504798 RepID=A0A1H0HUB6_9PSEU|nr:CHAT domain-containing protein [Actinokineospora alba]TDP64741.1 CHAT domain-containing protein [Actinokineospora alba]SDH44605.1 CHAT domain-containing protein [Actinokineospora alba]SDO22776.1 CHAT domain-containing protein [Actinokineospora alba]
MNQRALRRAAGLHSRAREAVYGYDFARARAQLEQALAVLADAPAPDHVDLIPMRVRVLVTAAYADTEIGRVDLGLGRLDIADRLVDDIADPGQRTELAGLSLEQRGFLLIRVGRSEEGLQILEQAAEVLERSLADGIGEASVLAILYLNRSLAHIMNGQPDAATAELNRCVELSERYDLDPTISYKAKHNLGYVAYMSGDMPTALRRYEDNARLCRRSALSLLPVVLLDQARAMLAAGLAEEAARTLDEALPLFRKQRGGQDAAEAEIARAAAALLDGDTELARRRARIAERSFAKRGNARWAAIAALTGIRARTKTALRTGRVRQTLVEEAIKLAESLRALMLEDEMALALLLAIRLELRRGDVGAAEVLLDMVPRASSMTPIDHKMLLRLCRAEIAVARGRTRSALAEASAGLGELGRVRDRMGGMELVCGTALHGQELGELAVRLVLDRPRPDPRQLFGWLERTRAQVYRYEPLPAIDDPIVAEKAAELRTLRRAVQTFRLDGRPSSRLEKQTAALEREVLRLGWSSSTWGRPRPVARLDEVTDTLGDRALVSLATSRGALVAVVVTRSRVRMVRLDSSATADEQAARLHADLDALAPDTLPAPVIEVVKGSAARSAGELDAQIVRPLLSLVGDRELIIVPTGALYAVPWGSLPSLRARPLVVAPSATAWLAASTTAAATGRAVLARGPMLTGDVVEQDKLRSVYPRATMLEGEGATVAEVLNALDGAELAHFAAHGEHEPTNALFSRLELADGPLFAYEVARLRQPPRQVVLAACELALNYVRPGDEALGYAGALLAGGVQTVVAATSRVGDAAAAGAMVEYHERLASGVAPARALAESIAQDPFRRPFICLGAG